KKIKNIAYRKNCTAKRKTIFAAYLNGEYKIFQNEYLVGTLQEYEQFVNQRFIDPQASKLKQAAKDCVEQLQKKLSTNKT
ncbi:hypothetical protein SASC598J21_001510, partial [Snodgrassella alvi SCGC AB-598-J21]